jgi:hypothetical protein
VHACISEAAFASRKREAGKGGVLPDFLACIRLYSTDHILNIAISNALKVRSLLHASCSALPKIVLLHRCSHRTVG